MTKNGFCIIFSCPLSFKSKKEKRKDKHTKQKETTIFSRKLSFLWQKAVILIEARQGGRLGLEGVQCHLEAALSPGNIAAKWKLSISTFQAQCAGSTPRERSCCYRIEAACALVHKSANYILNAHEIAAKKCFLLSPQMCTPE